MPKLKINREFHYTFGILAITTTEGGCEENIVAHSLPTIENAILKTEEFIDDGNTSHYLIVDFHELQKDKSKRRN